MCQMSHRGVGSLNGTNVMYVPVKFICFTFCLNSMKTKTALFELFIIIIRMILKPNGQAGANLKCAQ